MMDKKGEYKQALHLIDGWLTFQVYIKEIPGATIGVFVEDEVVFKKEYGYANLGDRVKLTDQHLFRIASQSKLFTATAVMRAQAHVFLGARNIINEVFLRDM